VLAPGAVATVGLVVIPTGPSFDGAWVMEGSEASEVKPEVRLSTSEGLELNLEVYTWANGNTTRAQGRTKCATRADGGVGTRTRR
jgi:hypothetical protein